MEVAINYLAHRVRRFSIVAIVLSPLVAIYHFCLFTLGGYKSGYYELGLALAFIIWGLCFVYPRKLAHESSSKQKKFISLIVFCLALFSVLIWFPLNVAITKH